MSDGKFTNTEIVNNLNTTAEITKNILKNPFYNFNELQGTVVTYYNVDMNNYPLDSVTGMQYQSIGNLTTNKYNKIYNFVVYGIDRIEVTVNDTEEGTEADEISGDIVILPNTIEPYAGDFFTIDYMEEKVLFRIIDAQSDTFADGANVYKCSYKLEHVSNEEIEKYNIGVESQFILENVGTKYNSVIEDSKYKLIQNIESVDSLLKKYYKAIFYNERVQSLTFRGNGATFYDSFLTEFVIRNDLLNERDDFLYLRHEVDLDKTFKIDYSRSFFTCIEERSSKKFNAYGRFAYGQLIDMKTGVFSYRQEEYLKMVYTADLNNVPQSLSPGRIFEVFDASLLSAIADNRLLNEGILVDIVIKYFNGRELTQGDLDQIETIDFKDNILLFYYVPIAIFILEYYIKRLMKIESNIA